MDTSTSGCYNYPAVASSTGGGNVTSSRLPGRAVGHVTHARGCVVVRYRTRGPF